MCIPRNFGRSESFMTSTQENTNLLELVVQAVAMIPVCPAGTMPVP